MDFDYTNLTLLLRAHTVDSAPYNFLPGRGRRSSSEVFVFDSTFGAEQFTIFPKQLRSSAAFGLPLSHWGFGSLHFLTGLDSGDPLAAGDLPSYFHRSLALQLYWTHGILTLDLFDLALINVNFQQIQIVGVLASTIFC